MNVKLGTAVALASTLFAGAASADMSNLNDGWFVGGDLGLVSRDLTWDENGDTAQIGGKKLQDELEGGAVFGLRVGKFVNDNVRVYTDLSMTKGSSYSYNEFETRVDETQLTLSADYVDGLFNAQHLQYFIGGTMGVNKIDVKTEDASSDDSEKDSGLVYGAQAGVIYNFTDQLSGELGYQYLVTNNEISVSDKSKFEEKNKQTLMLNVSYKF